MCVCVCYIHVIIILYFDSVGVSKKILFSVHMKVQFPLSWCVERDVSEPHPLSRNVHQEHGKYNIIHLTIIQESNLIFHINFVLVCHNDICYIHIAFTLSCNYEIGYVRITYKDFKTSVKKIHNILTRENK